VISLTDGTWPASINVPASTSGAPVPIWVTDVNSNVMPAETSVKATGSGATIVGQATYTVPCSAIPAGVQFPGITAFPFYVSGTAGTSGLLTITVTTPNGNATSEQISVNFTP
jgi:hypothetical protein